MLEELKFKDVVQLVSFLKSNENSVTTQDGRYVIVHTTCYVQKKGDEHE